jgi:Ca-activated chloride channel family protein
MLADDIVPNRIAKAQEVLISFLHRGEGVRFGLIIFAGKAFTLSPMTDDRKALEALIHTITPDTIRQDLP